MRLLSSIPIILVIIIWAFPNLEFSTTYHGGGYRTGTFGDVPFAFGSPGYSPGFQTTESSIESIGIFRWGRFMQTHEGKIFTVDNTTGFCISITITVLLLYTTYKIMNSSKYKKALELYP